MSIWTMTALSALAIGVLIFGYLLGVADGNEHMRHLYVDEQAKRRTAENDADALRKEKANLEEKLLSQQKVLERMK